MNKLGAAALEISAVFLGVATIFIALRLVSRIFVARKITLSDYVMVVGWALACSLSVAIFIATANGLGLQEEDVRPEWEQPLAKAQYAFMVLYNPTLTAIKSSLLIFYLTLSRDQYLFRRGTYLTLGLVNIIGLVMTLVNIFQCRPVAAAIEVPTPRGTHCIDLVALYVSTAPINIITDIAIFLLPMPILWRMRLPRKQKIILLLVFGTGLWVIVVAIIRTASLFDLTVARVTRSDPPGVHDLSYYDAYLFLWSAIELNLGIICGCVPSIKPLVARVLPRIIRNASETSRSNDRTLTTCQLTQSPPVTPAVMQAADATVQVGIGNSQDFNHDARGAVAMDEILTTSSTAISRNRYSSAGGMAGSTAVIPRFFDFVTFSPPKSLLRRSNEESLVPIAAMCVIFFLWGFAYGFIDVLDAQFRQVAGRPLETSFELHAAFFGAYFFGPILVARRILNRWGFKATLVTGLLIYSCGTLVFWPAAVLVSLPGFVISNFIVGLGLSIVETAANLFIALCGPMEHTEMRLNFAQGVQSVGGIVSPLLAQEVLFKEVTSPAALIGVQWTYLVISIVAILVAVAYNLWQLPEASNDELQQLADRRRDDYGATVCGIRVVWMTLALGVLCQFCNIGGQEILQTKFNTFVIYNEPSPYPQTFGFLAIGHTLFAIGRFLAALAQLFVKPRLILLGLYLGVIVFSILSMTATGYKGITMGLLLWLFNGGMFSIMFAICLRGIGKHTKTAASIMATAISGGAPFPVIQDIVAMSHGSRYAFCVTVALFSFGATFPLYLNLVPAAQKQVDPVKDEYLDDEPTSN